MTDRDTFAAAALTGLLADTRREGTFEEFADSAYKFADAMLARRDQPAPASSHEATWAPITTAPLDGTYILLAGPSGYMGTPLRVEVCRYDAGYHPLQPWVTHANNSFLDGGDAPTHWMPLPPAPLSSAPSQAAGGKLQ